MNVVTKTAEFILENDVMSLQRNVQGNSGRGLLRPARANQSERIGLIRLGEVLKGVWNQFFVFRQPKKTLFWSRPKKSSLSWTPFFEKPEPVFWLLCWRRRKRVGRRKTAGREAKTADLKCFCTCVTWENIDSWKTSHSSTLLLRKTMIIIQKVID